MWVKNGSSVHFHGPCRLDHSSLTRKTTLLSWASISPVHWSQYSQGLWENLPFFSVNSCCESKIWCRARLPRQADEFEDTTATVQRLPKQASCVATLPTVTGKRLWLFWVFLKPHCNSDTWGKEVLVLSALSCWHLYLLVPRTHSGYTLGAREICMKRRICSRGSCVWNPD